MLNLNKPQDTHHTHTIETVMGLDFGIAKMGIALGNTLTQTASPLMQFKMDNGRPNWDELLKIIESWQVSTIIVGLPLNMDGTASELGNRAKKFARRLKHHLAWEYGLIKSDKEPIDSIASAIMLGSWLRSGEGALLS